MTSGANLQESHKQIFSNLKDVFKDKVDHDVILLLLTECEWKEEEAFGRLFSICGESVSSKEINKFSEIADEIFQESYNDSDIGNDDIITSGLEVNGFSDNTCHLSGDYDFGDDCTEITQDNDLAGERDTSCPLIQQGVRDCMPVFNSDHSQQTYFLDQNNLSMSTFLAAPQQNQSTTLHNSVSTIESDANALREPKPIALPIPAVDVLSEHQHIGGNTSVMQTLAAISKTMAGNGAGLVNANAENTINMEDTKMPREKLTDVFSAASMSSGNNMATPLGDFSIPSITESQYRIRSISPIVNLSPNAPVFVPYYQSAGNISKSAYAFQSPSYDQQYGAPTFLTPKVIKSGRPGCKPTFTTQYSNPGMEAKSVPMQRVSQDIRYADMAMKPTVTSTSPNKQHKKAEVDRPTKISCEDKAKQLLQQHDKLMIVMRGCPGSGKTTLAREIVRYGVGGVILSTDDYFWQGDNYNYDLNLLTEAHDWNKQRAKESMVRGLSPVIIDNTNSQAWEMKPYIKLGMDHGYFIDVMEPETPWKFKVKELKKRNIHGVTGGIIKNMISRYQHNLTVKKIMNSENDGPNTAAEAGKGMKLETNNGKQPEANKGKKPEANKGKQPEANKGKKPEANKGKKLEANKGKKLEVNKGKKLEVNMAKKLETIHVKHEGKDSAARLVTKACDVNEPMTEMLPDIAKQPHCISGNLPDIAQQSNVNQDTAVRLPDGYAYAGVIVARPDNKRQGIETLRNSNVKRQPHALQYGQEESTSSFKVHITSASTGNVDSKERDKIVQTLNDTLATTSATNVAATQQELEAFIYLSPLSANEKQDLNALLTKKIIEIINIKSINAERRSNSFITKSVKREKLNAENRDLAMVNSSVVKQHKNVSKNSKTSCKPDTDSNDLFTDFAFSEPNLVNDDLDFAKDIDEEMDRAFDNNVWEEPKPMRQRQQHVRNKSENSDIENEEVIECDMINGVSDIVDSTKCIHNNDNLSHLTSERDVIKIDSHQNSIIVDCDSPSSTNNKISKKDEEIESVDSSILSILQNSKIGNDFVINKNNEHDTAVKVTHSSNETIDNDVSKLTTDVVRPKETKNISPRKRKDNKLKGPFLDMESKQKFLNEQWKMPHFDESEAHALKAYTSPPRTKSTRDMETVTSPHDFNDLYWVNSGGEASDIKSLKIKHTKFTPNFETVSSEIKDADNSISERNYIWKLDKGSSTDDLCVTLLENDMEFLQNCFPDVEKEDLKDVLILCDNNVEWSVNLLVDSDNLSKIDKGKLAENMEKKKGNLQLTIKQIVEEQGSDQNNPDSLLDMCVSVVKSNRIMSDAQIQDQMIRSGFDRLQAMENVSLRAALPSKDIPESPTISMITSPRLIVTPEQKLFRLEKKPTSHADISPDLNMPSDISPDLNMPSDISPDLNMPSDISPDLNMPSDILDLALPEHFAKNLVHLFGSADAINTDNLPLNAFQVSLDYRTCQLIYECWQRTMKKEIIKKNVEQDEVLARRLQEDENKGRKPCGVYLDQIISQEEKLHYARKKQQQNLKESGDQSALATQLKRQELKKRFPCIDEAVIEEIFEDNRYSLNDTVSALRLLDANDRPGYDVQAMEAGLHQQDLIQTATNQSMYDMLDNGYPLPHKAYQVTESPDYEDYRGELNVHYKIRNECFQKAKEAYSRGMKDVAFFYSQQGHLHTEKIKEAKHRATMAILADKNQDLSRSNSIDLHGLHVDEALDVLQQLLEQRETDLRNNPDKRKNHLLVITGRGSHSRDGRARIRPAILEFLRKNSYSYNEQQTGFIKVLLKYRFQ